MKTLATATQTAAAAVVKTPLWLVSIAFGATARFSSWGDVTWNGFTWNGRHVSVRGLSSSADGGQAGSLEIGNTDLALSTSILSEGIADRAIVIYQAYSTALSAGDPVQVFAGAGDDVVFGDGVVSISLASASSAKLTSPRTFGGDFSYTQPAGTAIVFNGEKYILER